ncbi:MAG TPA: peptide chain release factor 1 [Acidimicrobiia bacterium]|jgi:peptide chain release factor 1
MFDRLDDLESELEKLEKRLPELYASGDQRAAAEAGRRASELRPVVETYREHRRIAQDLADARELLDAEDDPEMKAYLRTEIDEKAAHAERLEAELKELLIPKDPNDGKNVIVEIRGAEGGEEANLWAGDLFRMYERYAERHRWKTETLSSQPSDMGGYRDITFVVKGPDAWAHLKHEAGPHRVQRVPVTESQGRVHTSAATVAVLPEAEEVDIAVDPNDLDIDVFRSTGPGGQSVNTTDSAVRMTHKPTGLVVTCQDEKSQLQNKDKALRILRSRLLQMEQDRQAQELADARRSQVGGGGRSEKIRTYNFKENRITDHRVGLTVHNLDGALAGDIDDIVDALMADERRRQLEVGES